MIGSNHRAPSVPNLYAHGGIREQGQWGILQESVEGRWACLGLGAHSLSVYGVTGSRELPGAHRFIGPGGMDGAGSPEGPWRGWATKETQDKLTVTSRERWGRGQL